MTVGGRMGTGPERTPLHFGVDPDEAAGLGFVFTLSLPGHSKIYIFISPYLGSFTQIQIHLI